MKAAVNTHCESSDMLEAIVDAYRYVETGQKTGIVVIDVGS